MAPNRSSAHSSLNPVEVAAASGATEERDIWSSILQQVQKTATNKLPSNKSIIVLGDNDSGKTSLIAKMQGMDTTCKGSGLEYHYLMVRDEYLDERTQCGVWILDGNYQWKRDLLKFALNAENFADTTVLLLVSMTKPWDIMNSLQHWVDVLEAHIKTLNLDPKVLENFREQNRRRFQDYISPGDEIEGLTSSIHRNRSHSYSADSPTEPERDPLPENVLCNNLGLDIVVAVAKTDYMSTLEKEYDYKEEHFDFIQQAIRKFCLNYGAALVYVSVKISKNCEVLFKYLVHRIYGLQFKTPALVVEKDAVFIPTGWDNEKKIAILYENIQSFSPDDDFNDIITVPVNTNPAQKDMEVVADEDQIFLMKLKGQLTQQEPSSTNTPTRPLASTPQSSSKDRRSTPSVNSPATPLMDGGKAGTPGGEGVLQNFFNQLLNRKSVTGSGGASGGGPGAGGPGGPAGTPLSSSGTPRTPVTGGSATAAAAAAATASSQLLRSHDVHAELDRIIEGNKPSGQQQDQ